MTEVLAVPERASPVDEVPSVTSGMADSFAGLLGSLGADVNGVTMRFQNFRIG